MQHHVAFQAEHCNDGQQQRHEGQRADFRNEVLLVPGGAFTAYQGLAGQETGQERDTQVDQHRLGYIEEAGLDDATFQAEQWRQQAQEDPGVHAEEQNLENAVEGDQAGHVLVIAAGDLVPYQHHGDATRQADDYQAGHVLGLVGKEHYCQPEHQHRADHPVLDQRQGKDALVLEPVATPRISPSPMAGTS